VPIVAAEVTLPSLGRFGDSAATGTTVEDYFRVVDIEDSLCHAARECLAAVARKLQDIRVVR
jgi:hypothetical protein